MIILLNGSLIKVSKRPIVFLLNLNRACRFERRLFDPRNHVNLRLTILSSVLQVQLVKAIGI